MSDPVLCTVVQLVRPGASYPGGVDHRMLSFHVSHSALCTGGHFVCPGAVLLVSCRAGDGGQLLPVTDARILTGGLVIGLDL